MVTAQEIISRLNKPTEADQALVEKAFTFAEKAHEGHTRYSGEPYMVHVADIALRLADMGMGPRTISAGLLHDTIEDTPVTPTDIKDQFGEEVLFLVDGVTKLSSVRYYGTDRHNESLRKLFVATSQDIRVLIIKLVDRLHNMRTLEYIPAVKQKRIATETLEIYAPVAHRLGIGKIRKELEDLAFPYVYPEEHKRVESLITQKLGKHNDLLERERKTLQKRLAETGMRNFSTSYRVKGKFSLFQKLRRKEWDIDKIYDLLAIRVVVSNLEECYKTLGVIHELWRPLPKRMKDYIAFPKPNGYQSIHTTVATHSGTILEIQIRTEKMNQESEYGVASHLVYKDFQQGAKPGRQQSSWFTKLAPSLFRPFAWRAQELEKTIISKDTPHEARIPAWIKHIGEVYTGDKSSGQEFIDDMRKDFFQHRIFVFTPNNEVIDLPAGATPVDFAYAIHSEIGDKMSAAKVNNKLVQLDTELKNGDIVAIETRKSAHPTAKWIDFAKTSVAKRNIRAAIADTNSHTR